MKPLLAIHAVSYIAFHVRDLKMSAKTTGPAPFGIPSTSRFVNVHQQLFIYIDPPALVRHLAINSFFLLVVMPRATSSILATSSNALGTSSFLLLLVRHLATRSCRHIELGKMSFDTFRLMCESRYHPQAYDCLAKRSFGPYPSARSL